MGLVFVLIGAGAVVLALDMRYKEGGGDKVVVVRRRESQGCSDRESNE